MAERRFSVVVATVALALTGLAVVAGPASADGVLTPSDTSVPVGGTFTLEVSGCDLEVEEGGTYRYQNPRIVFVTGVGGSERAITIGSGGSNAVSVPGWVDPDEPAELRGVCIESVYDVELGQQDEVEAFTYPAVAIDVTPAEPGEVRATTLSLDRDTAAGGQIVAAEVGGCAPGDYVVVNVLADTDLALGGVPRPVTSESATAATGPTPVEVQLHDHYAYPGGPLTDGDYVVVAACYSFGDDGYETWLAEPAWLYVRGTVAVGSMSIDRGAAPGGVEISGDGCAGLPLTVRVTGYTYDGAGTPIDEIVTPVQDPDGNWTATWTTSALGFEISVAADCGDPRVDGFRYPTLHWYEDGYSGQWIGRISPTASPVGGSIDVHVGGYCDAHHASVRVLGDDGEVLSEGVLAGSSIEMTGRATVTAPSAPGTYRIVAMCGESPSYPDTIDVFEPAPVAPRAPLPPGPTTGWPETGERETYNGRIGPITLPGEGHHGLTGAGAPSATAAATAGLGPSGFGVAVPRPTGDFAITQMSFDLVDEHGNPVRTSDAHLHHLVIANLGSANPACPGGTFGLPGEIIAAAGAERTALDFGDPYGLVVEEADPWAGVYEIMNMVDEEQTVYLTYDMEIRRDIENVRPVTTYFGSASGCGSFTWTIDGSGTPDSQGHYLTVAADGVLVGAGGHIHNGGLYTDLYDDRGRRLCRNELVLGEPDDHENPPGTTTTTMHDHGSTTSTTMHGSTTTHGPTTTMHGHGAAATGSVDDVADEETTTTILPWPEQYPPEMYPDDPPLEAITPCRPHEQLIAGERLYFEATYANDRARSGVMGIFMIFVWEGGGPARPNVPGPRPPVDPPAPTSPTGPTTTTDPTHPPGSGAPTVPTDPSGPTPPADPTGPVVPTTPSGPTSPTGGAASPGSVRPGGVASDSAGQVRPAPAARPHRGSAAYTG